MKIFKKAVTAFLAISTVVSLVACGGSGQGDYYGSNDNKLSIFRWDFDGLNTARKQKTDVYKILEEKAGMPIFAVTTGSADWETQLSTKFATEMLPDVFVSKGPEVPEQYKDMIEDGVLLPVSDYVSETEYPNIYRQLQDFDYLKTNLSYADGKHWSIPVDWTLEHTMYIRQDWLDNLNEPSKLRKCLADEKGISESQVTEKMLEEEKYEVPETLLDFYRVARAFTLYDPDGNGKNDTYGYTSTQELWTDNWIYNAFNAGWNFMIDDDGDGVYTSSWVTEGAKKAVAFTNRLYQEGYMAKGWNENDMGKKQDQFMQGKVGMIEAHAWYNTILKGFIEKNSAADNKMTIEEASEKIAMFAPPKGPDGYYGIASNPNFWTVTCLNAHMSEKERDAALSLIDFMFSEEGEELFTYGLEGTHYTVNDDGEKELIQEQDSSGFNKLLEDRDSAFIISSVTNWSRSYLSPFATNSEKIVSTLEKAKEYNRFADYPFVQPDSYIKSWKSLADHAETTFFNAVLEKDYYTAGQYSEKLPTTYEELCKFNDSFEEFWAEYLERYLEQMGGRKMTEDYNEAIKNAVKVAH